MEGKGEELYLTLHSHHQDGVCIKLGSAENHFDVSLTVAGQSRKTVHVYKSQLMKGTSESQIRESSGEI